MRKTLTDYRFWIIVALFLSAAFIHDGRFVSINIGTIDYLGLSRYTFERVIILLLIVASNHLLGKRAGIVAVVMGTAIMLPNALFLAPSRVDALFETAGIGGLGLLLVFLFDSRRKDARRLRELSEELNVAYETERQRMGQELHDSVGQSLTALGLALDLLGKMPPEDSTSMLEEARSLLRTVAEETRDLSHLLNPPLLQNGDLCGALRVFFERLKTRTGLEVVFTCSDPEEGVPYALKTALFRMVEEAITNVIRHARVMTASVSLTIRDGTLRLSIRDNGAGFDPSAVSGSSLGLEGMKRRADLFGGDLVIDSAPGNGTVITAVFPQRSRSRV